MASNPVYLEIVDFFAPAPRRRRWWTSNPLRPRNNAHWNCSI